jgi:hypothetical protein
MATAQTFELLLLKNPQELRLKFERKITNSVQE